MSNLSKYDTAVLFVGKSTIICVEIAFALFMCLVLYLLVKQIVNNVRWYIGWNSLIQDYKIWKNENPNVWKLVNRHQMNRAAKHIIDNIQEQKKEFPGPRYFIDSTCYMTRVQFNLFEYENHKSDWETGFSPFED